MDDQIRHYEEKLNYETDSWDLNDAIQHGENIVVIDARSAEAFIEEHIPGAMSLPHRTMNQETTSHLDRKNPLCDILRRHRLQCLHERRTQYGTAGISREGAYWRLGLVETRRLSHTNI